MSPYTEPEIVTDDTQMKSFDEIASVFENMVLIKNVWRSESDKFAWTLDVQEVRLGLMRVKAENIADTGLLISGMGFYGAYCTNQGRDGAGHIRKGRRSRRGFKPSTPLMEASSTVNLDTRRLT